jgi:hypothetical protein
LADLTRPPCREAERCDDDHRYPSEQIESASCVHARTWRPIRIRRAALMRSELAVYKSKLRMLGAQGRGPGLRAKLPPIVTLIVADDVRAVTRA